MGSRNDLPPGYAPLGSHASGYDTRELLFPTSMLSDLGMLKEAAIAQRRAQASGQEEASNPAEEVALRNIRTTRRARAVQIFSAEQIAYARELLGEQKDDATQRLQGLLADIAANGGYRRIPAARPAVRRLNAMRKSFGNLNGAIDRLAREITLSGAMKPDRFHMTPILLVGAPGMGKTFFAKSVAMALATDMDVFSAGGGQGAFQLSGSASYWSNSQPGLVLRLLARSKSATPVLVVDEVDKISADDRYGIIPALLDLLEPVTARTYKDESLQIRFDASRLIVIMTANTLDSVPAPLRSRGEVIEVPRPTIEQRVNILRRELHDLRQETGRRDIRLDEDALRMLARRQDLDLRKTTRILVDAFAQALIDGCEEIELILPAPPRHGMGFVS